MRKCGRGRPLNKIVRFHEMQRGSFWRSISECVAIGAFSFAVAFACLWIWGEARNFGPDGHLVTLSPLAIGYVDIVKLIYGPTNQVVAAAFDRLNYGGWVVWSSALVVSVTIQNLLLWSIGKWAVQSAKGRRS